MRDAVSISVPLASGKKREIRAVLKNRTAVEGGDIEAVEKMRWRDNVFKGRYPGLVLLLARLGVFRVSILMMAKSTNEVGLANY